MSKAKTKGLKKPCITLDLGSALTMLHAKHTDKVSVRLSRTSETSKGFVLEKFYTGDDGIPHRILKVKF